MSGVVAGLVVYVADLARVQSFYVSVVGLTFAHGDGDYVALEGAGVQVVLLRTAAAEAHRSDVVRHDVALKPVLVVADLAVARENAAACGGQVDDADTEWEFAGQTVCDGADPEGNVIQLRAG